MHLVRNAFIFLSLAVLGCKFDPAAILSSGNPEKRHETSSFLDQPFGPDIKDSSNFSFLIISDTHYGETSNSLRRVEQLRQLTPFEFCVINGDITQASKLSEWEQYTRDKENLSVPIYLTIGNHDLFNDGESNFFDFFGPSNYTIRIGDLLLVILDTGNGTIAKEQKIWYEKTLQNTTAQSVITLTHYALITKFTQHMVTMPYPEEFYWFVNTNDIYGVTAFISGHLHSNLYEKIRSVEYYNVTNVDDTDDPQGIFVTFADGNVSFERVALP